MTLHEAYERLELSQGAYLHLVRSKYAEHLSDYRMRIDNAPTLACAKAMSAIWHYLRMHTGLSRE